MRIRLCRLTLYMAFGAVWVAACQPGGQQEVQVDGPAVAPSEETVIVLPDAGPGMEPLNYLAALPDDGASADQNWPAIVFLHGSGERGGTVSRVKVHGPFRSAAKNEEFPFLIAAPHLPEGAIWQPEYVVAVVDDILRRWPVDAERIYLTGLSLGGHGTWATAAANPQRFAAIVPISGRGDPRTACAIAGMPIWSFHGVLDDVVAASDNQKMVDAVRACGGQPGLTLYPDTGHDAWTRTYDDPRLYEWLLSHSGVGGPPDRAEYPREDAGQDTERDESDGDRATDAAARSKQYLEWPEAFSNEIRDETWAPYAESMIREQIDASAFGNTYTVSLLECRKTFCRIEAEIGTAVLSSQQQLPGGSWNELAGTVHENVAESLGLGDDGSEVMTVDPDSGTVKVVTFWRRTQP